MIDIAREYGLELNWKKKETKFVYGEAQEEAFEQLKSELMKKPVLKLYEQGVETEIHTDASKDGYAAVMLQRFKEDNEMHPVQFMSKKTSEAEARTHSYELEAAAIVQALKKWRPYLLGQKFKVNTDCNSFAMTIKKRDVPAKVARWALYMQDFDMEIVHRSGTQMSHAGFNLILNETDALSLQIFLQNTTPQHALVLFFK